MSDCFGKCKNVKIELVPHLLQKLDDFAGIETENSSAKWLTRIAFVFLFLMVLFAPHSIAATQTAWLIGMLAWFIRLFVKPRPKLFRTPLDLALWAFFGWSVITSIFSYAPDISLDKLRGASLFLIFYFVINNLRKLRHAKILAFALVFSCMVNVLWTPIERIFGRGVEIQNVSRESPFAKALLKNGDTLLKADGKKVKTPEDLERAIGKNETTDVWVYRPDFYFTVKVKRADLLSGDNSFEKLGIGNWKVSRNWRSSGFYGHYATYAEVLQLIASLTFGLFAASIIGLSSKFKVQGSRSKKLIIVLFLCLLGMSFALLLTVTRASQLAFLISCFSIVLLSGNRKLLLISVAIALPVIIGGLIFLQNSREVGFFDQKDDSTKWRETVYREGFDLWTNNPRNFILGVGMDSIKRYKEEWHLFDNGKLPPGHFHSTPLQLVVERGFPALLLWLLILAIYARTLWKGLKIQSSENWIYRGILLGCFGGAIGFFTSGLVHYNLGDGEVAMVFFILMGISVYICKNTDLETAE